MTPPLMLYFRRHCHLCEQMLAEIHALYGGELEVETVDVDADPELRARYGLEVPVLAGREGVVCRGRLNREVLEAYLEHGQGGGPV